MALRAMSLRKKAQAQQQMKRSKSLGGLQNITESGKDVKKRPSFFKLPFFGRRKARSKTSLAECLPSEEGECVNGGKRSTLLDEKYKSNSTSCLSQDISIIDRQTPESEDCLSRCNVVKDEETSASQTETNSPNTTEHGSSYTSNNSNSATSLSLPKGNEHTPKSEDLSSRCNMVKDEETSASQTKANSLNTMEHGLSSTTEVSYTSNNNNSATSLSLPKGNEQTPESEDCLSRCNPKNRVEISSHSETDTSKTMEVKLQSGPSLTTSTHPSNRHLKVERNNNSTKIIAATRLELESAINQDDRSTLMSAMTSKTFKPNDKDCYGKTLLHTASSAGNYRCAEILINAGADVDLQDQAGFAPLHCAVVANNVPCAAALISAGANLVARTRRLHTPLTLAHEDEMILLIGRSLLLRGTKPRERNSKVNNTRTSSFRETYL